MRLETRTWFALSIFFFIGAVYFWMRGNEYQSRRRANPSNHRQNAVTNPPAARNSSASGPIRLLSQATTSVSLRNATAAPGGSPASQGGPGGTTAATGTNRFPYRLTNTTKPLAQLTRMDNAILMRNALIETSEQPNLAIPEHLKADGDPGSYIVQARGPIQAAFRERLREVGASTVSYIPNNAYLVQVSADGAHRLATAPETQAVLPYEPYYKLDSKLLPAAVDQKPLAPGDWLRVTAFPGRRDETATALAALGGQVVSEERTPFGPQLLVRPAPDSLAAIAKLASVQTIELHHARELLNDLTRVTLGVSTNGSTSANYLNLTGTNVLVNLADTGVDATNPDLKGRVFGDTTNLLTDPFAHGTHVAGIIAGNGSQSKTVKETPSGSETNANFRGMAPASQLFVLPYTAFPQVSIPLNDTYLVETAARTNVAFSKRPAGPMVSNNSWGYVGANEYDSSSARYDAAVRDAVPDMPGTQPMIFVFAAGNSGEGTDEGTGGNANSVPSPANAKNVIAVGAIEQLRMITNAVLSTNEIDSSVGTNALFLGTTDSSDQVTAFSSRGNIGIGIEGDFGRFKPDVVAPGSFIISTRSSSWDLAAQFDTNSPEYQILKEVNDPLAPTYRYESGTSQAAPAVSGMLALMQEFFEQRLPQGLRRTNSPAMMKALVINGARSVNPLYDFEVQNSINYQGWGLVNLTNSLPAQMATRPESQWPIRLFDESATNALATGQSRAWRVNMSTNAQDVPLRITLVWTDPPGNPTAAVKLVNDLDLVVSNEVTSEVFYGNDIRTGSTFNHASPPEEPPVLDNVNNVENVFIETPTSSNFVVSVTARRVNVMAHPGYEAATGNTNDIVQDFALVISTADQTLTNAFTVTPITPPALEAQVQAMPMTNGVPLLNERVGANPTLLNTPNGLSNQWNFYVFTNVFVTNEVSSLTNGTNVAFVTFLPPNASRPRNDSADIDLYVSKDPGLLQLQPAAVSGAFKSVSRSGTESVVFTNAALGDVFYIGVKSEDQQAGEYGLISLSSDQPFAENRNGQQILHGLPVPQPIPDGTAYHPGRATVIAIGIEPITVKKATVEIGLTHEDVGDLSMTLTHNQSTVTLHNHSLNNNFPAVTNALFTYDDQAFGNNLGARHSDGPGSLNTFAGLPGNGVWMLNIVDSAPTKTGRVQSVTIALDPLVTQNLAVVGAEGVDGTVAPHDATCYEITVPPEATNMVIQVSQLSGPVELFLEHGAMPTTNLFTTNAFLSPPGGEVSLGATSQPFPLEAGDYFVCLYNPGDSVVNFHIATLLQLGVGLDVQRTLTPTNAIPLLDNGVVRSTVRMPADKEVADVQVAVRIDHPRSSDLVLHLISPQGTSVLLAENRGGPDSKGYGSGTGTNLTYTIFTENTNLLSPNPIKFSLPPWTNLFTSTNLPALDSSFEQALPGPYLTNETFAGWSVVEGSPVVQSVTNLLNIGAHSGTNFVELNGANGPVTINTAFPTVQGKDYLLTFYYQRDPQVPLAATNLLEVYYGPPVSAPAPVAFVNVPNVGWDSTNITFTATTAKTELQFSVATNSGALLDSVTVRDVVAQTNVYVLPEESLKILNGQRAQGDWTLEVWDNRAGPLGAGTGSLIDWQLLLKYGSPASPTIPLTNSVLYTGTVSTNQTNFFAVDVCPSAQVAVATLIGPASQLKLLVSREGVPTGNEDKDDFLPITNDLLADETNNLGVASLYLTADPHQPAPLIPGKRLFFGVQNLDPTATNSYTFQVTFSPDTCEEQAIIPLVDNVPYTNAVAPSGILLDYYVFNVSPTAIGAEFEARPRNGDIGMVLRRGLPLPDQNDYDYLSDLPGITNELIVLTNTSKPVPLTNGDWYIGIFNHTTNSVVYDVRAREFLDTNYNIIFLTNKVPVDFTIGQGARLTNYFLFKVPRPGPGVRFDLTNLTGNADLLVGHDILPSYTNKFMSNSASPTQPVSVELRTNATLPSVRGSWVLEVISKATGDLSFTIEASLLGQTNAPPPETGTNRVFDPDITVSATNICFSWETTVGLQYELQGITSVTDTNWTTIYGPFIATNTVANYCIDLPSQYSFFRVVESGGTTPPPTENVITPALTVTTNQICLNWASTIGFTYQVQGKETFTNSWTNLTAEVTATTTNSSYCLDRPTPYHFFQVIERGAAPPPVTNGIVSNPQIGVSTNGVCLSWPSQIGTNYIVQGKRTVVDATWTNASPQITATATNTTYCLPTNTPLHVFQIVIVGGSSTNPPPSTNVVVVSSTLTVSTNGVCVNWASIIGTNYLVQAKRGIADATWTNASPQITATATNSSYCFPTNTPFHYFQVITIVGSATNPPPSTNLVVNSSLTVSSNGICVAWASIIGTNYFVQAKRSVADASWTNASPQITATATNSSYCFPTNTPFHYFQVITVGGSTTNPPPSTNAVVVDSVLAISTNGICVSWASLIGTNYFVQGKTNIAATTWTNASPEITATATNTSYCFPTNTLFRFFQVIIAGGTTSTNPPPATNSPAFNPVLNVARTNVCLSWPSEIGGTYAVEAKRAIVDPAWTNISGVITAVATNTAYCVGTNSPYRFFQILNLSSPASNNSTNSGTLQAPLVLTNGQVRLEWTTEPGVVYQLQFTTNLLPVIHWTTVTNLTARSNAVTVIDSVSKTNGPTRFYRVIQP